MFNGEAAEAMGFYTSIVPNSKIGNVTLYKMGEGGKAGTVMQASFTLYGQPFICIDSSMKHQFTFTPSISLYIECESAAEMERIYKGLSENGNILMPMDEYPFSKKYAWFSDKFGVSWQLNFNG